MKYQIEKRVYADGHIRYFVLGNGKQLTEYRWSGSPGDPGGYNDVSFRTERGARKYIKRRQRWESKREAERTIVKRCRFCATKT